MAEISNIEIQERARALAEADGFAWESGESERVRVRIEGWLSDERRQRYLGRARAELTKERANRP